MIWIAAMLFGHIPYIIHCQTSPLGCLATDEDYLAMLSTELTTGFGDTGLEQEWRTLWRWLAEMRPRDIEIFSLVIYLSNTITSNVCSELSVGEHGVVSETSFPELVEHLEIFVCSCISLVMRNLFIQAVVSGCAIQI